MSGEVRGACQDCDLSSTHPVSTAQCPPAEERMAQVMGMLVLGSTHSHTLPMNALPPRNSRDGALQRSVPVVVLGTCKTRSAPQLLSAPIAPSTGRGPRRKRRP